MARRLHQIELLKTLETDTVRNDIPVITSNSSNISKETIRICEPDIDIITEKDFEQNLLEISIKAREECILTISPIKKKKIANLESLFLYINDFSFDTNYYIMEVTDSNIKIAVKNCGDIDEKINIFYKVMFD